KPGPALLRIALERAGARAEHSVFIGDNPRTDGLAAARFGIPFIHVDRTGASGIGAAPC
ncbi:MAG: HAD family hydrolase, partial [Paracoccaceae bacterium]